jgi:hypothetical protein
LRRSPTTSKEFAELDAHRLVARRVLDHVLADEFEAAIAARLVDAYAPGRQSEAEAIRFAVLEFKPGTDRARIGCTITLVADR